MGLPINLIHPSGCDWSRSCSSAEIQEEVSKTAAPVPGDHLCTRCFTAEEIRALTREHALDAMQDCTGPIGTKVKVRMYEALLTCYRDAQSWKEGLQLTDEAFKNVPVSNHKSLWDRK